jgi:hypothetical protein
MQSGKLRRGLEPGREAVGNGKWGRNGAGLRSGHLFPHGARARARHRAPLAGRLQEVPVHGRMPASSFAWFRVDGEHQAFSNKHFAHENKHEVTDNLC